MAAPRHRSVRGALLSAVLAVAAGSQAANAHAQPTPLDLRRQAAFEAMDARHRVDGEAPEYPTPNLRLRYDHHEYYYQDKAAAIFGLVDVGAAPERRLGEANALLRYAMLGRWVITGPGQLTGDSGIWMHRSRSIGVRLYMLYSHWMDGDIRAEYERRFRWMIREPFTRSSENIKMTNTSSYLLAHEALGETDAPTYAANRDWLVGMMRRFGTQGFHEWGGPYNAWTFVSILNLAELSTDEELRRLATMVVDHYLARQLTQSIGGHFTSARVRSYVHWTLNGHVVPQTLGAELLVGDGTTDRVWMDYALSNYRPLTAHAAIAADATPTSGRARDDTSGDRSWRHYWQRGRRYLMAVHQTPERNGYVLPSGGTHDIVQALVASRAAPRRIVVPYPYDPRTPFKKKRNLNQRSFGHDNVAIVQNSGTTRAVWAGGGAATGIRARLYHDIAFRHEIDGGWAFVTDGSTYVAWAPGIGAPMVDPDRAEFSRPDRDGSWLRSNHVPDDEGEPVVIEVGDADSFGSFAAFQADVKARNPRPRWDGTRMTYTTRDGTVLEWRGDHVRVDGAEWDPAGWPRSDTPWLEGTTVTAGGSRIVFDFEAGTVTGARPRVASNVTLGRPPAEPPPSDPPDDDPPGDPDGGAAGGDSGAPVADGGAVTGADGGARTDGGPGPALEPGGSRVATGGCACGVAGRPRSASPWPLPVAVAVGLLWRRRSRRRRIARCSGRRRSRSGR